MTAGDGDLAKEFMHMKMILMKVLDSCGSNTCMHMHTPFGKVSMDYHRKRMTCSCLEKFSYQQRTRG